MPILSPALFLDRDGVINEEAGYLFRPNQIVWVPGIFDLCRVAVDAGLRLVVVTNQSGIARGLYTEADFDALMTWMQAEFRARGVPLDGVYHCPYHPRYGVGRFLREHEDRKPAPGMLYRAAADLSLDLSRSLLVGDRCSDIAAANAAGLRQAFLINAADPAPCSGSAIAVASTSEIAAWIRNALPLGRPSAAASASSRFQR